MHNPVHSINVKMLALLHVMLHYKFSFCRIYDINTVSISQYDLLPINWRAVTYFFQWPGKCKKKKVLFVALLCLLTKVSGA